jgi:hypothetical protein
MYNQIIGGLDWDWAGTTRSELHGDIQDVHHRSVPDLTFGFGFRDEV